MGESQFYMNYVRTMSDYITNFCFGKGVQFQCPQQNGAIIPQLLHEVWENHNSKHFVLWEMGQLASVTGDCFVKIAYEEPYVDPLGVPVPGRIRIIPLNPAHCFPEYHPHDRSRLLRFKLKYRFWGCVDTETEALTKRGWVSYDELKEEDEILTLDAESNEIHWQPVTAINVYDYDGHMVAWDGINAVSTPNHRWLVEQQKGRLHTTRYERMIARTEFPIENDPAVTSLRNGSRVVVGGGIPMAFADEPSWQDEVVETVAWYITEGWDHTNQSGTKSIYLAQKRPDMVEKIRRLKDWWSENGCTFTEYAPNKNGVISWYLGKGTKQVLWDAAPNKEITPEFISSLTYEQAVLFYETLLDGDGCRTHGKKKSVRWTQLDQNRKDAFQMLAAMLGKRTSQTSCGEKVQVYSKDYVLVDSIKESARRVYLEDGKIWCPTVESGIWFARRRGETFWTGNTSPEGTRQVYTFTEILTDEMIQQFINDELIDQYPNALGMIPVVHIRNTSISSSPWGQSDIWDIIPLNRELNEKMTEVSDIINYHAAPVTIITGAKASQLERGPKKVWAGLPKDANVFNLESRGEMAGALEYITFLKRVMHEVTGVPETALGQFQPVSNTSGVALAIQYQPMMNRYNMKKVHFTVGLEMVNEIIIRTAAIFEPQMLIYDPTKMEMPERDQATQLDPADPLTYKTTVHWPEPLPVDVLIKLNEVQAKMALGLESKEGALRILGEEFPREKLAEIFEELQEDAMDQGALDMLRAQISQAVMLATGMIPAPGGPEMASAGGANVSTASGSPEGGPLPGPVVTPMEEQMVNQLVAKAYGARFAQRRIPDEE